MSLENEMLRLSVRRWVSANVEPYCPACKASCCYGKVIVNIAKDEPQALSLFKSAGLEVHTLKELDLQSVKGWVSNRSVQVMTQDKRQLKKPCIIEVPLRDPFSRAFLKETDHALYADRCPFYFEDVGCSVHEDTRRPFSCVEYPVCFETEGNLRMASVYLACGAITPEVIGEFKERFPEVRVMIIAPPKK